MECCLTDEDDGEKERRECELKEGECNDTGDGEGESVVVQDTVGEAASVSRAAAAKPWSWSETTGTTEGTWCRCGGARMRFGEGGIWRSGEMGENIGGVCVDDDEDDDGGGGLGGRGGG